MMPGRARRLSHFEPNWAVASEEDRKTLYKFAKRAKAARHLEWDALFREAGMPGHQGIGYDDNFRKGKISKVNAGHVYRWLATTAPAIAEDLRAALFEAKVQEGQASWPVFISTFGRFDDVEILPVSEGPFGIVKFAEPDPVHEQPILLGQRFVFRIASTSARTVLCFQGYKDVWYPLPLSKAGFQTTISTGKHVVPACETSGALQPLSEEEDAGMHRFVFLLFNGFDAADVCNRLKPGIPVAPEVLNNIANGLLEPHESHWDVLRINAQFISPTTRVDR